MKRALIIPNCAAIALAACTNAATAAEPPPIREVIPLIEMVNVPLTDAIQQMARQARLNILLDPRLSAPPYTRMTVSIRWEKVTAMEALTALLENHGLMLVGSPRSAPSR
jgi:hypothetical protein